MNKEIEFMSDGYACRGVLITPDGASAFPNGDDGWRLVLRGVEGRGRNAGRGRAKSLKY